LCQNFQPPPGAPFGTVICQSAANKFCNSAYYKRSGQKKAALSALTMKRVGDPEADYSDAAESKNVQTAENCRKPPTGLKTLRHRCPTNPSYQFLHGWSQCTLRTEDFTSSEPLRMCRDTN
jgi:hypothetical protein